MGCYLCFCHCYTSCLLCILFLLSFLQAIVWSQFKHFQLLLANQVQAFHVCPLNLCPVLRCLAKSKQKSKYLIDIRSTLYLLEKVWSSQSFIYLTFDCQWKLLCTIMYIITSFYGIKVNLLQSVICNLPLITSLLLLLCKTRKTKFWFIIPSLTYYFCISPCCLH